MPTEKKAQSIDRLEQELAKANIGILTDYRGLKTPEINSLRRKLQDVNGDYKVVKNTLVRKAAEKLNQTAITGSFEGPTAIAFGYGDISQLAKTFSDHVRTSKMNLSVKGGFMQQPIVNARRCHRNCRPAAQGSSDWQGCWQYQEPALYAGWCPVRSDERTAKRINCKNKTNGG